MSHTQLRRIELGRIERVTVEHLARGCAAVGLQLVVRTAPGPDLALDRGQLAVIGRLRRELPGHVAVRMEVPLALAGDKRAWDLLLGLAPAPMPVEAEARLRDLQALLRRCALKLRDSEFDRMLLLVSDNANNRRVLEMYREDLRAAFPLDSRHVMAALRLGAKPEASGIAIL